MKFHAATFPIGLVGQSPCGRLLLAAAVLMCAGCWEEIHYDPHKPVAMVSPPEASETEVSKTPEVMEQPIEDDNQPVEQDNTESVQLTESALFESEPMPDATSASEGPSEDQPATASEPSVSLTPEVDLPEETTDEDIATDIDSASTVDVLRPSRTALATWRMSSRWSLAAAIYAKGQPEDRYRDLLDQATYAAELVSVEMPAFPAGDSSDRQARMIRYLLDTASAETAAKLGTEFPPEYASLTELAIKTHVLLLVYTPKSEQLEPLVIAIRQAAENSGLPRELWGDLVGMLERREPFADVKQQVLTMHTAVGDYLGGGAEE